MDGSLPTGECMIINKFGNFREGQITMHEMTMMETDIIQSPKRKKTLNKRNMIL